MCFCEFRVWYLTHWGPVTHICIGKQTIIGSDNGLSPGRRQAIIWTNGGILLIRSLGTNFSEILSKNHTFSFKKMLLKTSSAKWRPSWLGLNVLFYICHCCIVWQVTLDHDILRLHWTEAIYNKMQMLTFWWFSSLAALEVVRMTTSSAANDENFIKMMTFPFQCMWSYSWYFMWTEAFTLSWAMFSCPTPPFVSKLD